MATLKQSVGNAIFSRLPVSRHVFDHFRLELNAVFVRTLYKLSPQYRARVRQLRGSRDLLVNVGCGPFGQSEGWVNLDLMRAPNVSLKVDCRRELPLADNSCAGIHVEMFLEHLDPVDEVPVFLREIYRCLKPGGVGRFIVPDADLFISAYVAPGWDALNRISYGYENWSRMFPTKMDALNHVFQQGYEHYGGWNLERATFVLSEAGFREIRRCEYGEGAFPGKPIDREFHRQNALYVEVTK